MDATELKTILDNHKKWLASPDCGGRADLCGADLRGVNLCGANLCRADLDFSCWPLWCGSKSVKIDRRIAAQLAAHFCAVACDDPDYQAARAAILEFAKSSHRAVELGLTEE